MPIRPENKDKYPDNWQEISLAVRQEAGWKCEWCGAENGEYIWRLTLSQGREFKGKVVLTVAHLDHDPANCERKNLRALCQKCHNSYDAPVRAANRKRRLLKEAGQLKLDTEC